MLESSHRSREYKEFEVNYTVVAMRVKFCYIEVSIRATPCMIEICDSLVECNEVAMRITSHIAVAMRGDSSVW